MFVHQHQRPRFLTCMPANEVAFGFRCTSRTSLLGLTTTRLAEGLRACVSLALDELVTMVCDEIERGRNLRVNMVYATKGAKNTCDHLLPHPKHSGTIHRTFYTGACHAMYGIKKLTAVEFLLIIQVIPVHHLAGSRRLGRCRPRTRGCKVIGVKVHVMRSWWQRRST